MIRLQALSENKITALPGVFISALIVGLAGDILLRPFPWGIGFGLWMAVLATALAFCGRASGLMLSPLRWALIGGAALFAFGFALRDSPILCSVNLLGASACLALAGFRPGQAAINVGAVSDYLINVPRFWMGSLFGIFPLMRDEAALEAADLADSCDDGVPARKSKFARGGQLLRGTLLAVPFLLIFGTLLLDADPVFRALAQKFVDWLSRDFIAHIVWSIAIGVLAAGLIRKLLVRETEASGTGPQLKGIGGDVCVALALIDILFLLFVLVQFQTLFDDASLIQATAHITYTQYVHSGFFELVWVAGLALPTLLILHWLLAIESGSMMRRFNGLALGLIAEILVIMASAVYRMIVYVHTSGLTEWRLYPTVFMGWLAFVLVWFVATVLSGRRDRFMFGAVASALIFGLALDAINPDAFVVRVNASPNFVAAAFPATYAGQLSADATTAIVGVLPRLSADKQDLVSGALLYKDRDWTRQQSSWQCWNYGRAGATSAIAANRKSLTDMNKTPYAHPGDGDGSD